MKLGDFGARIASQFIKLDERTSKPADLVSPSWNLKTQESISMLIH